MKVVIMRGPSGSGKSTYVTKMITEELNKPEVADRQRFGRELRVCSADHFWIDDEGNYKFDASRLSEAHADCYRKFVTALLEQVKLIVIDNTNTMLHEMAPYMAHAKLHGYEIEIVRCVCNVNIAAKRNVHGVPASTVQNMERRMENIPRHWGKEITVVTE